MTSQEWASDSHFLTSPIHTSCKQCCHGQLRLAFQAVAEDENKSRISGGVWPADVALALWVTSSGHQARQSQVIVEHGSRPRAREELHWEGERKCQPSDEICLWYSNVQSICLLGGLLMPCVWLQVPWCGYWDITREGVKLQFTSRSGNSPGCSIPWHLKEMTILNPRCYDEPP